MQKIAHQISDKKMSITSIKNFKTKEEIIFISSVRLSPINQGKSRTKRFYTKAFTHISRKIETNTMI